MKKTMLILLPLLVLTACTHRPETQEPQKSHSPSRFSTYQHNDFSREPKPIVQTDRYTLVELDDPTHKYALDQIINTSLPKALTLSVKEGLTYLLDQSGYSLCNDPSVNILYENTLPKVQYKMGPVKLGNALQIIAGPAWKLTVDDVEREICFELKDGYHRKVKPEPELLPVALPKQAEHLNMNSKNQVNDVTGLKASPNLTIIKTTTSTVKPYAEPPKKAELVVPVTSSKVNTPDVKKVGNKK